MVACVAVAAMAVFWLLNRGDPLTPLLLVGWIGGLWLAIVSPLGVCLLFVAMSMFRIHEAVPILLPLQLPLVLAALTLAAIVWKLISGTLEPFWPREVKLFIAFFLLVTFGMAGAIWPIVALDYWNSVYWKIGLITLVLAWLPRRTEDFVLVGRVMVMSGIIIATSAIHGKYAGESLIEGSRVAIGQTALGDPNDLALVLLIPLSFCIAFIKFNAGRLNRWLGLIGGPLILCAIIFTQSRGGLLGLLALTAGYGRHYVRSRLVLVPLVIALGVGLYAVMGVSERQSGGAAEAGIDASAQGRLDYWIVAIGAAGARPLTGIGLSNFPLYNFVTTHVMMEPHNTWLEVLAETGFPGLGLFVLMIAKAFQTSVATVRKAEVSDGDATNKAVAYSLSVGLVAFCVSATFLTHGFTWPIYVLIALTSALSRLEFKSREGHRAAT